MTDKRQPTPRRVLFRQCDLERAIRAARATGAGYVIVHLDDTIAIEVERPAEQKPIRPRGVVFS